MSFTEPVTKVAKELFQVSQDVVHTQDISLYAVRSFPTTAIPDILSALEVPLETRTPESTNDDPIEGKPDFYAQAKEFVLFSGVQKCIDNILRKQFESSQEKSGFPSETGNESDPNQESGNISDPNANPNCMQASNHKKGLSKALSHLFACLDFVLLELAPAYDVVKRQFFFLLEGISDQLLRQTPKWLAKFWSYMETRSELFHHHVFSSTNTANRIAVLGFCNHVTDLYYDRNSSAKYDSYKKDSFNDKLHARVRVFLAKLLDFEDSTGLNKHFVSANRVCHVPNFSESESKSGDDQLLEDLLRFQKVLRNPYLFLKNPADLAIEVDSISKLNTYFLGEETKYARIHPTRDVWNVSVASGKEDLAENGVEQSRDQTNSEKPNLRCFFPESYWTSAFDDLLESRDKSDPPMSDKEFGLALLDSSKYRRLVIVQIFLVCNFFLNLTNTRKKDLLSRIGSKTNSKHITEDYVPEHIGVKLNKIKTDTLRSVRVWDHILNFFLLSLAQSEENWIGWLIYGKKKDGSGPLLVSHANISASELSQCEKNYENAFKFKTKRYFNTHVTAQLSRRMKTPTGLEGLRVPNLRNDYKAEIQDLAQKIESEADPEAKAQFNEERVILVWKSVKGLRNSDWLALNEVLSMGDFGQTEEEKEEKKEETEEEEKKVETNNLENSAEEPKEGKDVEMSEEKEVEVAETNSVVSEKESTKAGETGESGGTGKSGESGESGEAGQTGEIGEGGEARETAETAETARNDKNGETRQSGESGKLSMDSLGEGSLKRKFSNSEDLQPHKAQKTEDTKDVTDA